MNEHFAVEVEKRAGMTRRGREPLTLWLVGNDCHMLLGNVILCKICLEQCITGYYTHVVWFTVCMDHLYSILGDICGVTMILIYSVHSMTSGEIVTRLVNKWYEDINGEIKN